MAEQLREEINVEGAEELTLDTPHNEEETTVVKEPNTSFFKQLGYGFLAALAISAVFIATVMTSGMAPSIAAFITSTFAGTSLLGAAAAATATLAVGLTALGGICKGLYSGIKNALNRPSTKADNTVNANAQGADMMGTLGADGEQQVADNKPGILAQAKAGFTNMFKKTTKEEAEASHEEGLELLGDNNTQATPQSPAK